MTALLLIALAAALAQPSELDVLPAEPTALVDEDGAFGWRCSAPVEIGRYKGSVWRDYGRKLEHSPYTMQVELPDPANRHLTIWTVDPRPEGPPARKKGYWPVAVREADAFRNGPGYVHVEFKWEPTEVAGPLWAHFWGDGVYAGAAMMMKARDVRRYYPRGTLASGKGVATSPDLIAKLAPARTWTAIATDGTGRQLASETFAPPARDEAEAAFRKARAAIDALEPRFAVDHEPREEGGAGCTDEENPASTI